MWPWQHLQAWQCLHLADLYLCMLMGTSLQQQLTEGCTTCCSRDATIMGSRNGHAPIYMWYTLTSKGYEGIRKDVEKCLRNAHLLHVRLDPSLRSCS